VRGACALVVVLSLAACTGGDGEASTPTTRVTVYFVRGEHVGAAGRDVPRSGREASAAVRALLDGPTDEEEDAGLHSEIPDGTKLHGMSVRNDVATVNLSREFEAGGGSASMLVRVAQVVYTLTQLAAVNRVRFEIDGEPREAIGGEGVLVDPPVGRGDFEDQTPPILIEAPTPGDTIGRRFTLSGTANTFEATVNYRLVDSRGDAILEEFTTATSGSGTRGTFEVTVGLMRGTDGPATLVAFERSAVDGSETKVVEIPVVLRR
jgi:germination protein M